MKPTEKKKRIENHSGYNRGTKLKWWGILVGNQFVPEVIIAARTKEECFKAAKRFHPTCDKNLICPITVGSRVATLSRPSIRKPKISPDKEPSGPAEACAGKV
jgi:hypothetical protein